MNPWNARIWAVGIVLSLAGCTHFSVDPGDPAEKPLFLRGSLGAADLAWIAGTQDASLVTELGHTGAVAVTGCAFVRSNGERLEFRREVVGDDAAANAALAVGVWPLLVSDGAEDGMVHIAFDGPPGVWEVQGDEANGPSEEVFWDADDDELRIRFESGGGCSWSLDFRLDPGSLCGREVLPHSIRVDVEGEVLRLFPPAESADMQWEWTVESDSYTTVGAAVLELPWNGEDEVDVRCEPAPGADRFGEFRIELTVPAEAGGSCAAPELSLTALLPVTGESGVAVRYRDAAGRWYRSEGACAAAGGQPADAWFEVLSAEEFLTSDQGHATRRCGVVGRLALFPEDGVGNALLLTVDEGFVAFPLH